MKHLLSSEEVCVLQVGSSYLVAKLSTECQGTSLLYIPIHRGGHLDSLGWLVVIHRTFKSNQLHFRNVDKVDHLEHS